MDLMNVLQAVLVLGITGAVFGFALAFASKVFAVPQDERVELITGVLPGVNCGGCGYTGCSGYAAAIASGEAAIGLCTPGGDGSAAKIADIMGVAAEKTARQVALVKCRGGGRVERKFDYYGINDCLAATKIGGNGPSNCAFGCLGFGSCTQACQFGAISVKNGMAAVDHEKCTGCLACVDACPRHIIIKVPYEADITVACSSKETGGVLRKVCDIGCIGCKLCEKTCRHDAIHVVDNVAQIDYSKCVSCSECAEKCPRGLISDANLRTEFNVVEPRAR